MIGQRQIEFRKEYRSRIRGWYDGYFHIAIIYAMGTAACAQVLLEHQITAGPCAGAWPGGETIPLTGMSHGAAGIAYALCRLYQVTTEPRLLAAAEAAMRFENTLPIDAPAGPCSSRYSSASPSTEVLCQM